MGCLKCQTMLGICDDCLHENTLHPQVRTHVTIIAAATGHIALTSSMTGCSAWVLATSS